MIYPIRYFGDPILRKVASPVTVFDDNLKELAANMLETMHAADGVGLAAPQIGVAKRMFVALEMGFLPGDGQEENWGALAEHVIVNPEISRPEGTQHGQEGCLSVPGIFVENMKREATLTLKFRSLDGEARELQAEGHFAQVIQHELDHLDGILFFDRLPEPERRDFMREHRQALADMQRAAKAHLKSLRFEEAPALRVS